MKHNTRKKRSSKLCVVFDIDETILVFLNQRESIQNFTMLEQKYKDRFDYAEIDMSTVVIFRPGFEDFIRYAKRKQITLAIWTYGDRNYAKFIERIICKHYKFRKSPFLFVYSNSEIKEDLKNGLFEKDLRRIFNAYPEQYTSSNTFLVDNKPSNIYHETNMHNGFIVESFAPFLYRGMFPREVLAVSHNNFFEVLEKICDKIIKKNKVSNTPIFGEENVKSMDLNKYYKKYVVGDKKVSVLSTDHIDYDKNFTLIE
jgi:hypothetical protein